MEVFTEYNWEEEKRMSRTGERYLVRLRDHILKGEDGQAEASMFSFSYLRLPQDARRPVIFAYNGGPGAASNWLHMGLLGPKLVKFPGYPEVKNPAEFYFEENREFLLDLCDLVLIDPVGTAWANLFDQTAAQRHYSTGGDARDFTDFIIAWLSENGRQDAPVYLLGESYGTIRNVALADSLPDSVDLRGIIHIGTSLNVGAKGTLSVEPNVRRLGANAAACWYHYHREEISREDFLNEAMKFAYGDYARALLLGNRLCEKEREQVLEKLSYYSGISKDFLREHSLRFGEIDFVTRLRPGEVLSIYDSRLVFCPKAGEKYVKSTIDGADIVEPDMKQDVFMASVGPAFGAAFEQYSKAELCLPQGREEKDDKMEISRRWDYRSYEEDTLLLPVKLMERRPRLRMMFVIGYFDLSSTFDFVIYYLSQYSLPKERVATLVLPSGHAAYVGEGMAETLNRKIREFISHKKEGEKDASE